MEALGFTWLLAPKIVNINHYYPLTSVCMLHKALQTLFQPAVTHTHKTMDSASCEKRSARVIACRQNDVKDRMTAGLYRYREGSEVKAC